MLTDMSWLQQGAMFPPFDERVRLNHLRDAKLLYEGHHDYVFHRWNKTEGVEGLDIKVNWHRRLSLLWADMLVGQPPEIKSNNDVALNEFLKRNQFNERLYESAIDVSRFGTSIAKLRYVEAEGAVVDVVPADIWFPVINPANVKDVQQHVLAWKWSKNPRTEIEENFLSVEIHHRGRVEYITYSLTGSNGIGVRVSYEEEMTGVDKFLVYPISNVTTSNSVYGENDYDDINSLVEEIEMRLTQLGKVLDKHADPSMYGDESALEYDDVKGEYVVRGGGSFYPVTPDGVTPAYITWDANLESAQKQVDLLMQQFYVVSQTSPAAFGDLKDGLVESGSALKRLLMATIIKVNRLKIRYEAAITYILELAGEMQSKRGQTGFANISVEFKDALPEDEYEKVQNEVMRINNGLSSVESSVSRIDNISGEALEREMEAINVNSQRPGGNDDE